MPDRLTIDLENLCVDVPNRQILRDVNWQVPCGARATIIGPNGCGKSTLLKAITAYGHLTSGRATILGETLGDTLVHQLRRRMGIVDPTLVRLLDENVTTQRLAATGFFGHLTTLFEQPTQQQLATAAELLTEVGLANHLQQDVMTLSSGQRSRLWLARALVHEPELLILDEPTADLDLLGRETLLATLDRIALQRPDLTIVIVTHHLEDLLPNTDHVLLLSQGKTIANGSPSEVLTPEHLSTAFGCDVEVQHSNGRWHWSVVPQTWQHLTQE
ncbi:MAG: ATP-binding cassette domain-containing protein [Planctomycetaceae bacterium]|nr:ATP-binding cassette domain-containing protein [Planctomycetaceae bacterium]